MRKVNKKGKVNSMKRAIKKPTIKEIDSDMKDIRIVLSRVLTDMNEIRSALGSYIDFKKDTKKWTKWIDKKIKNSNKSEE